MNAEPHAETHESRRKSRELGISIVEVSMALALLSVFVVSYGMTMIHGIGHRRESIESYAAFSLLRDTVSAMEDIANQPEDLVNGDGVGAVYGLYHDRDIEDTDVPDASIHVLVHANETTVPATLGGAQDLNLDGDAADNLDSIGAGPDLKIVPIEFTLTYFVNGESQTFTAWRLLTKTSD